MIWTTENKGKFISRISKGMTVEEAGFILGENQRRSRVMAKILKIKDTNGLKWSSKEAKLLQTLIARRMHVGNDIAAMFDGKTITQINAKIAQFKAIIDQSVDDEAIDRLTGCGKYEKIKSEPKSASVYKPPKPTSDYIKKKPNVIIKRQRVWTDDEVKVFLELLSNGYSLREVAREMNMTYWAVRYKLISLRKEQDIQIRLKYSCITEEELSIIKRMYKDGFSVENIAKKLGRSSSAISNRINESGLNKNYRSGVIKKWTDDEVKDLLNLYNNGIIQREIAAQLGKTLAQIRNKLYRLGESKYAK